MSLGEIRPASSAWPGATVPRFSLASVERILLAGTVLVAVALIWLSPRLPMTDLPQHAAQVTMWRDLLLGRSPWSGLVRINLLTPYLIGYGLTLPLAFVVSVETALRLTLSAGLLGFIGACLELRRQLGGDPRLDWLFPVGWFGIAWQWGFVTFLVGSPVALLFLWAVLRAADVPNLTRQALVVAVGCLLLLSHGLLFVVFLPIGGVLALWAARRRTIVDIAWRLGPFAVLALVCLAFRLASAQVEGAMQFDHILFGSDLWLKPIAMLLYVTNVDLPGGRIELPLTALLLLAPFLLRCRLNRGLAIVPFLTLVAITMALPSYAYQTVLMFHRFALFLLPLYAVMFRPPAGRPEGPSWAMALPMLACWFVLGTQAERTRAFAAEARPFETVLAAAAPGKRALSLMFDAASASAVNRSAYLHFPLWYQADKGGFVDFNFAYFHPQVVRFRPGALPDFTVQLSQHPWLYDGSPEQLARYDYVFVHGSDGDVAHVVGVAACPLRVSAADGGWTLLERGACPPLPPAT